MIGRVPASGRDVGADTSVGGADAGTAGTAGDGLVVEHLVKDFGAIRAVDDVSLRLPVGRTLAVFGPNGAGKTTLLRILAGLTRPDSGRLGFAGEPRTAEGRDWRGRIGVLSHRTFLYAHLTAMENLLFQADLHGLAGGRDRARRMLERVGLGQRAHDHVETFSRGMRQRLGLARTLLHDPDLVLLDEPFSGLDVHGSALLAEVLETLRDGRRCVVLVTHDLSRGLGLASDWLIMVNGRVARAGETGETGESDEGSFHDLYRSVVEDGA